MSAETTASAANTSIASGNHPAVKEKSSAGMILTVAVLAILGGGGSTWFVLQHGRQIEAAAPAANSAAPKYLLHLEGFTVNLADPEETHFLRVTLDLGVDHLPPGTSEDKSTTAIPVGRVRDAILSVLTSCKADALLTADGKGVLKRRLVDALQHEVPELGVREVYFTEFLVQRQIMDGGTVTLAKEIPFMIPEKLWEDSGNLPCTLSVDLKIARFTVRDLFQLAGGVVVESVGASGADVPMVVNTRVIGWAEFEVIGEHLAVRVTELA